MDIAPMLVALFLILLTFFIVLTSMAQMDARRTREVLGSVHRALDAPIAVKAPNMQRRAGSQMSLVQPFRKLRKTVAEVLAIVELDYVQTGETLQITIPVTKVFAADSATLLAEGLPLIQRIGSELQTPAGSPLQLQILMADGEGTLQQERLAKLHRMLADAGIATQRISLGFDRLPADAIRMQFVPPTRGGSPYTLGGAS